MTPKTNEAILKEYGFMLSPFDKTTKMYPANLVLEAMRESQSIAVKYALQQAAKKALRVWKDEVVESYGGLRKEHITGLEKEILNTLQQ